MYRIVYDMDVSFGIVNVSYMFGVMGGIIVFMSCLNN